MPLVIGLSATPFAKGMGKAFTNLVNAATMHELTQQGILVPMRVFSCRKPDMAGAETKADIERLRGAAAEADICILDECKSFSPEHLNDLIENVVEPGLMTRDGIWDLRGVLLTSCLLPLSLVIAAAINDSSRRHEHP